MGKETMLYDILAGIARNICDAERDAAVGQKT